MTGLPEPPEQVAMLPAGTFDGKVARAAADSFRKQNGGAYVHMTSTSGLIGNFGQANYATAKLGIVGLSRSIAIAMDMQRFRVRSNCIAPFAWTRLVGTIPADTPEEKKPVEGLKKLEPEKDLTVCGRTARRRREGERSGVWNTRQ